MFNQRNTETGILGNFVKCLVVGLDQNKGKETRKISMNKETKQNFWMQDLIELKSMHPSNPVCTCNSSSLECFEDSANPPS